MFGVGFLHLHVFVELRACLGLCLLENHLALLEAALSNLSFPCLVDALIQELHKDPCTSVLLKQEWHFIIATSYESSFVDEETVDEWVAFVEDLLRLGFNFLRSLRHVNEVHLTIMGYIYAYLEPLKNT